MNDESGTVTNVTDVPRPAFETNREHFSWSQLNMFLRCSMQYYWRYVMGRKERPKLDMTRGKAGHYALEVNARHKISTRSDDHPGGVDQTTEQILDTFSTAFDEGLKEFEPSDFDSGDNPGKEKDSTIETLRAYRGKHARNIIPLAVELEFNAVIPPTEEYHEPIKPINGKIDQIIKIKRSVVERAPKVERIAAIDYKFPGRLPSNMQDTANMSTQLDIYDIPLSRAGKPPEDLGYIQMVPATKTLAPRIIPVFRDPMLLVPHKREAAHERTLYKIRTAIRAIRRGIFIPQDDPRVCRPCGYRDICQFSLVKKDYEALQFRARDK